jgi:hypothetical protein
MTAFTDEMDKLAAQIAKDMQGAAVAMADRIDAFKALTPYYVWQMKNRSKDDPEDEGLPTFDNFTTNIHAAERINGSDEPGVRGSRRNGN